MSPKSQTFREFCEDQIQRLPGAFPDMRFYQPGAIKELVNWLEAKAGGNEERAAAVITEVTEFESIPSIAQLNQVWDRMFPQQEKRVNHECEHCNGTGWESVTALDRFGAVVSGARRCRSGCGVPALAVAC